jgi:hypothetical protein
MLRNKNKREGDIMKNKILQERIANFGGYSQSTEEQIEIVDKILSSPRKDNPHLYLFHVEDFADALQFLQALRGDERLEDIARFCADGHVQTQEEYDNYKEEYDEIVAADDQKEGPQFWPFEPTCQYRISQDCMREARKALRFAGLGLS